MKQFKPFFLCAACLALVLLAGACSVNLPGGTTDAEAEVLLTAEASNPLPTQMANQSLAVVPTKACQVDKFVSVQTKASQGDMLAWSPTGDTLAYVTPSNEKWGWFVGNLVIEDIANQKAVYTSQSQEVAGDLTWSPDGSQLAYVVLDPKSKVYTVDVLNLSTGKLQDVFGFSPVTDSWSSPKGIDKWTDSYTLIVNASCDVDCVRPYTFNTQTGKLTQGEEMRKSQDLSLDLTNEMVSSNSRWTLAIDNNDNLWLASAANHQASIILAGTTTTEFKWSKDSGYLAVRTDDSVLVYQPICSK
jgi:Periplasmic component of the Tol biopolymer transport system